MAFIIIDKESKEQMRSNMHEEMRHGYRKGGSYREKGSYHEGYRHGYREGYEDCEDDWNDEENYRRQRDSRGRFM